VPGDPVRASYDGLTGPDPVDDVGARPDVEIARLVAGQGTDATEQGRLMWARVKGKTENDLLKLPFKAAYMFRPAGIQPLHGIRSKTAWVQAIYVAASPLLTVLARTAPNYMTTPEQVGRAMIKVARDGYPRPVLESGDINAV